MLTPQSPDRIGPQTVDRFGRTVAAVFAGSRNVNLAMVRGGQEYAYRDYLGGAVMPAPTWRPRAKRSAQDKVYGAGVKRSGHGTSGKNNKGCKIFMA